jgi:Phosphate-induced protein 1 conserved region
MKIQTCYAALLACGSILCMIGTLSAQDVPGGQPRSQSGGDGTHAKVQSEGAGAPEIVPHRTNPHEAGAPTAGSTGVITPDISYHGGPVMGTPNVYLIWYGNWNQSNGSDTPSGQQIIRDFLHGLSGSNYYVTNASYPGVTGSFVMKSEYTDSYSQGTRLTDAKVQAVVSHAIDSNTAGHLPKETVGIYFVLTSSDVSESSGFCKKYCGWHTSGTISNSDIKYAFVGNANRCLNACAAQTVGPNGNSGVDGMVSVIAHELEETNTDPDLNAWFDANGAEDADKCAWTFGSNQKKDLQNGAFYNMTLIGVSGNSRNFLVQRELDVNSKCYVDYMSKAQ